jgi:hypothetical protein
MRGWSLEYFLNVGPRKTPRLWDGNRIHAITASKGLMKGRLEIKTTPYKKLSSVKVTPVETKTIHHT